MPIQFTNQGSGEVALLNNPSLPQGAITFADQQPASTIPVIQSGLVLYVDASIASSYPGSSTTWFDLSGNGYNATLSGNASYSATNGGRISLGSGTGFVNFGGSSAGSNTSAYSWGAWFSPPQVSSTIIFMGRGRDGSGAGWSLAAVMLSTGFNASIVTTVPSIAQINASYSTTPTANAWYNYMAVWSPGSSLKVYVNGVLRATALTSSTVLRSSTDGWTSTINTSYNNANLGSMIAYNRVLSDSEVLSNYNATKTRFGL